MTMTMHHGMRDYGNTTTFQHPIMPETFGQMLKIARRRHRMTQDELVNGVKRRGISVTQGYISLIERTAGTAQEPEVSRDLVIAIADALQLIPETALKSAGHHPQSPLHRIRQSDEVIRMRIQTEFEVVLPNGETRPLRASDLSPEMRHQLAEILLSGQLDDDRDADK